MMKRRQFVKSWRRNSSGFTMIEVIAVLVILAIVSAVVTSRGMATDDAKLQAEVDTLKGHIRFAQYRAMNDLPTVQWGISLGGSNYTLVRVPADATINRNLPGESSDTHTFASGVTASVTGDNPILFNDWGSPGTAATVTMGGKAIAITANTGFIP